MPQTDGQMDRRTMWNQYTPLSTSLQRGYNNEAILFLFNTLRQRQNCCHFADDIFLNENVWISLNISMKFVQWLGANQATSHYLNQRWLFYWCIYASLGLNNLILKAPGPWFNIKMSSYQYRKSHCGDKTVVRSSYLHNGISYTGKMMSFYWIDPQGPA